jgi:hypothetical protein
MPRDFAWFLRIKPTPLNKLLYIRGLHPREETIIRYECQHADTLIPRLAA